MEYVSSPDSKITNHTPWKDILFAGPSHLNNQCGFVIEPALSQSTTKIVHQMQKRIRKWRQSSRSNCLIKLDDTKVNKNKKINKKIKQMHIWKWYNISDVINKVIKIKHWILH